MPTSSKPERGGCPSEQTETASPAARPNGAAAHSPHAGAAHHHANGATVQKSKDKADRITARDPVCGMIVDPHTAAHRHHHAGRAYYFCSAGCLQKFAAAPDRYIEPSQAKAPARLPEGTIYTCPMHPQVRQIGPGSCPICGMALEPLTVTAEPEANPELAYMSRRLWIGAVLTLPLFAIEMGSHFGVMHLLPPAWSNWISLALSTPVV